MRKILQMILVLTLVGLISGTALVFMYKYANPLMLENQRNEIEQAIFKVFPEARSYDREIIKNETVFKMMDRNSKLLGFAFLAEGYGYQGRILMMVGIKADLETLIGIEILESQETPGLGQEITQDKFKSQFRDLKILPKIAYTKDKKSTKSNEIQAITGATVSSNAVVLILNEKLEKIRNLLR